MPTLPEILRTPLALPVVASPMFICSGPELVIAQCKAGVIGSFPALSDAVHSCGGIVLHDVINDRFARKAIEKGADGLIAVAAGAGGHAGTQSPFALVHGRRQRRRGHRVQQSVHGSARQLPARQHRGGRTRPGRPARIRSERHGLRLRECVDSKAWKDIWGAGQGIGAVTDIVSAQMIVDRMVEQYDAALTAVTTWSAVEGAIDDAPT